VTKAETVAWSFWEGIGAGDLDRAFSLLAPDGVWWSRTSGEVPFPVMEERLRPIFLYLPMRFELRDAVSEGNTTALELQGFARFDNGVEYNNWYCFVMTVRGGAIRRIHEYVDTAYAGQVLFANLPPELRHQLADLQRSG
jgi:ketosteroid isomerase-like protein